MRKTNSYDYMRVFAAFAVVFLHTCAPSLHNYNSVPLGEWLSENALDSLVRWSVPVFFMLSGAFLLDPNKQESLPDLFKKRVPKIVIPLFVWSIVYYFAVVYGLHEKPLSFTQFITDFLNNDIINHLWFLYILLGLYLLTPILKIIVGNTPKNLLIYFLILWFITNSIFGLINHLFDLNIYFDLAIDDYVGYYILGYLLRTNTFSKKFHYIMYSLAVFGILMTFFGTYIDTTNAGKFSGYYYKYLTPNVVLTSMGVFLFIKNLKVDNLKINPLIQFISSKTFGIYLIHILVLGGLTTFGIDYQISHPIISIPIVALLIFVISLIAVTIMQKIPFVKNIVP